MIKRFNTESHYPKVLIEEAMHNQAIIENEQRLLVDKIMGNKHERKVLKRILKRDNQSAKKGA